MKTNNEKLKSEMKTLTFWAWAVLDYYKKKEEEKAMKSWQEGE